MNALEYDIAVIGGGPGGLAAAHAAWNEGVRSLAIIEAKGQWGAPVQCAGYAPRLLGRALPFEGDAIRSRSDRLDLLYKNKLIKSFRAPGYIFLRDRLEADSAKSIRTMGADCLHPARVESINEDGLTISRQGEEAHLRARVIIAADGPRSLTRHHLGLPPAPLAMGLEYELPLTAPLKNPRIYFDPAYGADYAWVFPHGNGRAGIGLALDAAESSRLKKTLIEFVETMAGEGVVGDTRPLKTVAGPIPVGRPLDHAAHGNILLVGDAAGQTNPLTGAGIFNAAMCGELAGKAAAKALRQNDLGLLTEYDTQWKDLLGALLDRAFLGRESLIDAPPEEYLPRLKKAWMIRT